MPITEMPLNAEALVDPTRFVVSEATGDARGAEAATTIREAARLVDKARGPLRNQDPEEALRLWEGLVRGRWTLLDWFDTDGRRFVLWGSDAGPIRGVDVSGRSRSRDRSFFLAFWAWSRAGKSISAGFISWRGTSLMRIMRR